MMQVRTATAADVDLVMDLIDEARGIMRADGNTGQWVEGYPTRGQVERDVAGGAGYAVLDDAGTPVGYFAFLPGPEPTYARIYQGRWLNDAPYHVVHRIASRRAAHGVFATMLAYCLSRTRNLRIDTHRDNRIMQRLLQRHAFTYCGIIYLDNGDERLAYQLAAD